MIGVIKGTMRQKKEVNGLPLPIASYKTQLKAPIRSLKVAITAKQSGSGDPYPAGGSAQKWDEEWEVGGYAISNGQPVAVTDRIRSKNYIRVIPSTTYFSKSPQQITVFYYDENKLYITYEYVSANRIFATPDSAYYMMFASSTTYGTTYNHDISINYPATDTEYHPYSNIRPITGWSECNVVRCGVNVWDEEWELANISGIDGTVTEGDYICSKNFISVIPSIKYRIMSPNNQGTTTRQYVIYLYGKNKDFITYVSVVNQSHEFIIPNDCYYIKFRNNLSSVTYNNDISINYPATDTNYHAYAGNTYTIQLGDTYYGGSLDVTTGELTVTWKGGDIKDFDWQYSQTLGYFSVELADSETGTASDMPNLKTSVFKTVPYSERTQHSVPIVDLRNQAKYVEVRNTGYTDVTTFKQAFAGQTLIYKLATPITVQLTPTQVEQLLGANNVWADTGDVEELIYTDRQVYYGR